MPGSTSFLWLLYLSPPLFIQAGRAGRFLQHKELWSMTESLILTEVQGKVGVARLNRPDAYNALNAPLMRQLGDALAAWDADPAIGAMVITGNDRAFASGADIKEMSGASAVEMMTVNPIGAYDRVAATKKP